MNKEQVRGTVPGADYLDLDSMLVTDIIKRLQWFVDTSGYTELRLMLDAGANNISIEIQGGRLETDKEFEDRKEASKRLEESRYKYTKQRKKELIKEAEALGLKLVEDKS